LIHGDEYHYLKEFDQKKISLLKEG